ncbi:MAG: hypothetical protein ACOX16_02565 [Candidatus Izemoplasmatales bacterium]|jgi:hypothetical protein
MTLSTFFTSSGMDDHPTQYLFKWQHFLYIIVSIILFIFLMKIFKRKSAKTRKLFVTVCCVIMLLLKYAGEVLFIWEWNRYGDQLSSYSHPLLDFRTLISFQLCGVNNVLLPLVIWFDWKKAKDFIYSTSIIGGLAVIIYPVGVLYGDPFVFTFPILRSLVVHFLLFFVSCFQLLTGEFVLRKENWLNTLVGCILITAWAMIGNLFIDPGANNMYLMANPFYGGPVPILNVLPDGYHMIVLVILVFLAFVLVYSVFGLYNKKRLKQLTHTIE